MSKIKFLAVALMGAFLLTAPVAHAAKGERRAKVTAKSKAKKPDGKSSQAYGGGQSSQGKTSYGGGGKSSGYDQGKTSYGGGKSSQGY